VDIRSCQNIVGDGRGRVVSSAFQLLRNNFVNQLPSCELFRVEKPVSLSGAA